MIASACLRRSRPTRSAPVAVDERGRRILRRVRNEGLWPLCHIAHVRPTFRTADWEQYRAVNAKFADAVVAEAHSDDPVVLVQDYHFALLPRMIRERCPRRPSSRSGTFVAQSGGVRDLSVARRAAARPPGHDILGFHTVPLQQFPGIGRRFVEARIDRETFTVVCRGEPTAIHRYPISIEWPPAPLAKARPSTRRASARASGKPAARSQARRGIDRLDYTKGIVERFNAVARLLELHPEWVGKFTFVQIAAPSRGHARRLPGLCAARAPAGGRHQRPLPRRRASADHPDRRASRTRCRVRIPSRGRSLLREHLHDGMNLGGQGIRRRARGRARRVILSQFAGASRELPEASL